jgi:hypothetical protein
MSHNVTLPEMISPVQAFAIEALASGATVTAAAEAAGVARETVSRWVHHDPVFIAELHNIQAEMAAQTRLALGTLGMRAVWTLRNALADKIVRPTNLRAACSVLKMLGADRAETLAPTTPQDVHLRFLEHEQELSERRARLDAAAKSSQEPGCNAVANSESQDCGESEDAGEWLDDTGAQNTCATAPEATDEQEINELEDPPADLPAPESEADTRSDDRTPDRLRPADHDMPGEMVNPDFPWTCAEDSRDQNEPLEVVVHHSKKQSRGRVTVSCGAGVA